MEKFFKEIKVAFGLGKNAPITVDGVNIGGILRSFKFEASQSDVTTAHLEIFCNKFEINDNGTVVIDDVTITDESIIEQICRKIMQRYWSRLSVDNAHSSTTTPTT